MVDQPINHCPPIKRYRLQCYAIENAILTDPCLAVMRTTWEAFVAAASKWVADNPQHKDVALVDEIAKSGDRLRHMKVKEIRQLVCALANCNKPWEVVVGQQSER